MKSLLSQKIISQTEYDTFNESIRTVAGDFIDDFNKLIEGDFNKNDFLIKYGHLRPGTYDITSMTYREDFEKYVDTNKNIFKKQSQHFTFSSSAYSHINQELKKNGFSFDAKILVNFIRKSIEARELAKFQFTKCLSVVLDSIVAMMVKLGITREETAYLDIEDILYISKGSRSMNLENELNEKLRYNREKQLLCHAIRLPVLIFSSSDIDFFHLSKSQPNFVTHKSVVSDIVILPNNEFNIENKIVLIENADPGFDWIFSHNIKGIVTCYGGIASHISIRCAEFGMPAAIGCGDVIFNKLKNYKKINLDCSKRTISGIWQN